MRASDDASFTLIALMTGTRKAAQNSGGSAPWSCTAPRPHAAMSSSIRLRSSSTNTPTLVTNGGSAAAISPACEVVTRRRLGAKTRPMASAPASAATSALAPSEIPQILTRVKGYPLTIVIASAALPGSPQIRRQNLRGGKRSPHTRRLLRRFAPRNDIGRLSSKPHLLSTPSQGRLCDRTGPPGPAGQDVTDLVR